MKAESERLMQKVPRFLDAAQAHWLAGRVGSYQGNLALARDILIRVRTIENQLESQHFHLHHPSWQQLTKMNALIDNQRSALEKTGDRRWGSRNAEERKAANEARRRLGEVSFWNRTRDQQTTQPLAIWKKRLIEKAQEIDEWVEGDSPSAKMYRKVRGKPITRLLKGADICWKCGGSGILPHFYHVEEGACFACKGTGMHHWQGRR